jgi:hypothetical protein
MFNDPNYSERVASIPDVSFVVLNLVAAKKLSELILVRYSSMMLFLIQDIVPHFRDL